jgi:hypothetical protein
LLPKKHPVPLLAIDLRAPCPLSRFPSPEGFEASAMPTKNGLRLNDLGHAKQARPNPGHPYEQCPISPAQSKTGRCTPQRDVELMTKERFSASSPNRGLNKSATNIPSARKIASIAQNDAMILPHEANPTPDDIFGNDNVRI